MQILLLFLLIFYQNKDPITLKTLSVNKLLAWKVSDFFNIIIFSKLLFISSHIGIKIQQI